VPNVPAWFPGFVSTGVIAGFQFAATLILMMRACDGTPDSFSANSIQNPGGASAARVGAWMRKRVPSRTNVSSTKRCSMFQLWVTDAVLTMVTRLMSAASVKSTKNVSPMSICAGALVRRACSARAPVASYRYGGK
jgi:hypothetical protein